MDRTLQSFEHVDAHQPADAPFASRHGETGKMVVGPGVSVFVALGGQDKVRRGIDGKVQLLYQTEYLVVIDGMVQVGQLWATRKRRQAVREFSDVCRVVVLLDVFAAPRNGHGIEHLKEVEIKSILQRLSGAVCSSGCRQSVPDGKCPQCRYVYSASRQSGRHRLRRPVATGSSSR